MKTAKTAIVTRETARIRYVAEKESDDDGGGFMPDIHAQWDQEQYDS